MIIFYFSFLVRSLPKTSYERKQYKKYKEFYQVDIDIIKKMIETCENISLIAKRAIRGTIHNKGVFIYIDKDLDKPLTATNKNKKHIQNNDIKN